MRKCLVVSIVKHTTQNVRECSECFPFGVSKLEMHILFVRSEYYFLICLKHSESLKCAEVHHGLTETFVFILQICPFHQKNARRLNFSSYFIKIFIYEYFPFPKITRKFSQKQGHILLIKKFPENFLTVFKLSLKFFSKFP